MSNSNKFVFFGCWNNVNENSNLKNTMSTLTNYLTSNPEIPFVVVGGDNFYPDKSKKKEQKQNKENNEEKKEKKEKKDKKKDEKKDKDICTKIINLDKLTSGFNLLPKDIPIYMLLGNHDLETNVGNEQKFCIQDVNPEVEPEVEEPNSCTILQHEKELVKNSNITLGTNFATVLNNTLLLMIDTSIYDTAESELYVPCYNNFYNKTVNIEELRSEQNAWIARTIVEHVDNGMQNIIVMGHHPITGYKVKKDECILTELQEPFIDMWKNILNLIPPRINNISYLCADIHNYQESVIIFNSHLKKPIHQYIVGTGGTELDAKKHINCAERIFSKTSNDIITYTLKTQLNAEHGFLDCDCSGKMMPTFTFIPTDNQKAEGKKKRKTRKKPNKRGKKVKSQKFRRI
jgi:hypothetical protein